MRKFLFGTVLVIIVLAGCAVGWQRLDSVTAQETRTIDLLASQYGSADMRSADAGDPCVIASKSESDEYRLDRVTERIIVTDASGEVISAAALEGVASDEAEQGYRTCLVKLAITVPDSPFYVISLGDDYLMTISRDDLPLTDPLPLIVVS